MKYLLDTNTCIRYLNGRPVPLRQRLQSLPPDEVAVRAPVKAELFCGAAKSMHPARTRAIQQVFLDPYVSLPFDDDAAQVYGLIRADLATRGTPIGPTDLLIAAIALTAGLTLVTHNTREFSRVTGLLIEDWEATP